MPHYNWVCHSCHRTNLMGAEACSACACPALASVADIEAAKTDVKQPPPLSRKQWQGKRRAEIAVLPFWKKPIAYVLQAISVVGGAFILSGILDFSLSAGLFGVVTVLVAEALLGLLKERSVDHKSRKRAVRANRKS